MERANYWGFRPEQKERARKRSGGYCEFPAGCNRPNTGIVSHITGSCEGRRAGFPREVIQNVDLNSVVLCRPHEVQHDIQEQEHLARIGVIYERPKTRRGTKRTKRANRPRFTQKRRG